MIRDTFWNDKRMTAAARGVGAFVAEHPDGAPLAHILSFFRDPQLTIACALDELEALGYVSRHLPGHIEEPDTWQVTYAATDKLVEVAA